MKTLIFCLPLIALSACRSDRYHTRSSEDTGYSTSDRNSGTWSTSTTMNVSESDNQLMNEIHRALNDDHSISGRGRSVKVLTQNGNVLLRGSVNTNEERREVEKCVQKVAGVRHIDNEIDVRNDNDY